MSRECSTRLLRNSTIAQASGPQEKEKTARKTSPEYGLRDRTRVSLQLQ